MKSLENAQQSFLKQEKSFLNELHRFLFVFFFCLYNFVKLDFVLQQPHYKILP